jgi:hypothetical protein
VANSSLHLAREKRDRADRVRRLAFGMTREEDRIRLYAFADELDAQASALERKATGPDVVTPPPTTQVQEQAQQQGASRDDDDRDDPQA